MAMEKIMNQAKNNLEELLAINNVKLIDNFEEFRKNYADIGIISENGYPTNNVKKNTIILFDTPIFNSATFIDTFNKMMEQNKLMPTSSAEIAPHLDVCQEVQFDFNNFDFCYCNDRFIRGMLFEPKKYEDFVVNSEEETLDNFDREHLGETIMFLTPGVEVINIIRENFSPITIEAIRAGIYEHFFKS